jgi:hypothetical protein
MLTYRFVRGAACRLYHPVINSYLTRRCQVSFICQPHRAWSRLCSTYIESNTALGAASAAAAAAAEAAALTPPLTTPLTTSSSSSSSAASAAANSRRVFDAQWESRFNELVQFKQKNQCFPNECEYKSLSNLEKSLEHWCRKQRFFYVRLRRKLERHPVLLQLLNDDNHDNGNSNNDNTGNNNNTSSNSNNNDHNNPDHDANLLIQNDNRLLPSSMIYRIQRLRHIGFKFELQADQWNVRYEQLCQYVDHHGNALVPYQYSSIPELGVWVRDQRYHYAKYREGRISSMTPERIQLLNEISFVWNVLDMKWNDKYQQLQHYMQIHGIGTIPSSKSHKKLRRWMQEQVKHYRKRIDGKDSAMTDTRLQQLQKLGFPWSSSTL